MAEEQPFDLSRVVVVGTSCSGKTTFAHDLAARLGVSHVEMDRLYWLPGWIERKPEAFLTLVDKNTAGPRWVTDGNYTKARDVVWPKVTAIIWLNYPFPLVFWRSLKRTFHRALTRQEICNGNVESWRILFSRQSILLWVISTYGKNRERYRTLLASDAYPEAAKIQLTSPRAAKAFLASVSPAS